MKGFKVLFILTFCSLFFSIGFAQAEEDSKTNQVGEVFELGEIVITANSGLANLATTVTEVNAEDITARGVQTVAEALEMIPGVNIKQSGKNAEVFLRGFAQEDVKVLIDGVPAYQTYDKVVDLSLIPIDSISKITVTKGASSVLYGANTFGGVINIITKKGGKKSQGEVTVSFGKNSTQNYSFNYGGSVNVFNYWITASRRVSDGFELSDDFDPDSYIAQEASEDGGIRNLSDYEMNTFSTKLGYVPSDDMKVYVSFDYHNNEKGVPSGGSPWRFIKWDQWHLNLVGEKKITDLISTKARLFYVSHKDTLEDVDPVENPFKWFETSSYDDSTVGAEVQTSFDYGPKSYLTVGLNFFRDNHKQQDYFDEEMFDTPEDFEAEGGYQPEQEYESETFTIAVEDEIRLLDNDLAIVVGASYDYYKPVKAYEYSDSELPDNTDSFNPQVGVVYNLFENTSLHASTGKKVRFPRMKELFSYRAHGDDTLKPQETITFEIGADHFFTPDMKASVALFYNDITDLILRLRDPDTRDRYYSNVGESTIQGLEFTFDYQVLKNLSLGAAYTYLSAYNDTDETRILDRPRHKLQFDARYRILTHLFTSAQASYTTGTYEENADQEIVSAPGFFLVNAKLELSLAEQLKDKIIKDASLFIRGDNLFDKDYHEGYDPQPGRSVLFGFNAKF